MRDGETKKMKMTKGKRDWDGSKKQNVMLEIAAVILASFCITVLSLVMAYVRLSFDMFVGYFTNPMVMIMNFIPIAAIHLLLWAITGRVALSNVLTGTLVVGGSIGNYFKVTLRDDPVLFSDLTILKTAMDAVQGYEIVMTFRMKVVVICTVVLAVLLFFVFRRRKEKHPRARVIVVLLFAVCFLPFGRYVILSDTVYDEYTKNGSFNPMWVPTQHYISKGFVYPFLYSMNDVLQFSPSGYNEKETVQLLAEYTDTDIPEDRKVNVIAFQLEAFADMEEIGLMGVNESVYAAYRDILAESYSGNLMTNIFAGGTVDTEWSLLTGFSELPTFRTETNSYVWYLKEQGYVVEGSHPGYSYYYDRLNINRNLGFDDYLYIENHYGPFNDNWFCYDDIALPEMLHLYREAAKADAPVFHFNVTYQGHGPYAADSMPEGDTYWNPSAYGSVPYEDVCILNNYLWCVKDTGERMRDFLDELRYEQEPVVVLMYGDHKPWLGDMKRVYYDLEIPILDSDTDEGMINYYGTDYIIWANEAAKELLDNDFRGEGPTVGSCFLMNTLFDQLGWKGNAFMQLSRDVQKEVQVVSSVDYYMEDDLVLAEDELSSEAWQAMNLLLRAQYYWRNHFIYGN